MIGAARGWVDRVRYLAFRRIDLAAESVELGRGVEQHSGVWMLGIGEEIVPRGFLDKLAINEVGPFQEQLIAFMKASHGPLLAGIVEKGAIDDATDKTMKEVFTKFTADFRGA